MNDWPRPFPEVTKDRRTDAQRASDAAATAAQADGLRVVSTAVNIDVDYVEMLQQRRAAAPTLAVPFEVARPERERETLIVPGELLIRRAVAAHFDEARGSDVLAGRGFRRVEEDPADDNQFHPGVANERLNGEFAARVQRWVSPEASLRYRLRTVREVTAAGMDAGVTSVMSQHPVTKAPGGPAHTEVVDSDPRAETVTGGAQRQAIVAIIDTGIASKLRDGPGGDGWLDDVARTVTSTENSDAFPIRRDANGQVVRGNGLLDFGAGHGTFAAGVVRQVAPSAIIRAYAALDSEGLGSEYAVACAMIQAVQDGADIINLSLGMSTIDNQPPVAIEVALDIIDEITEGRESPVFVAAAGNAGTNRPMWPAASRRVIAVAALTPSGPAAWSSRGVWVDCSTIGQGIVSTFLTGVEDTGFGPGEEHFENAWGVWSGTSFAAPQLTGAIARTMFVDGLSARQAARRVIRSGVPVSDFGRALEILPGT